MRLKNNSVVPLRTKKGQPTVSNVKGPLYKLQSSDDEGSGDDVRTSAAQADPTKPWLKEFNQYLDTTDELSDGQDRKSTRLNSSHLARSRMPSSA